MKDLVVSTIIIVIQTRAFVSSFASSSSAINNHPHHHNLHHHTTNASTRRATATNSELVYDLPPFALSFRSQNILPNRSSSDTKTILEDGVWLASTLGEPLKLIVTEFLTAVFRNELAHTTNNNSATGSASAITIPDIVWQFLGLELHVRVHFKQVLLDDNDVDKGSSGRQRQLLRGGGWLQSLMTTRTATTVTVTNNNMLDFYTEFTGTAKYLAPPLTMDSSSNKKEPSAEVMYELLGQWMEAGFTKDLAILKQMLQNSEVEMLQSHQMLSVQTHIMAGVNPFETSSESSSSSFSGNSKTTFLSILLVGGIILTMAVGLFTVQKNRMKRKRENVMFESSSFRQPHHGAGELEMNETSLPGRCYGEDALKIIQASEEYLAKHRPDLYSESTTIGTKNTSPLSGGGSCSEGSNYGSRQYDDEDGTMEATTTTTTTTTTALSPPSTLVTKGYTPVGTWFKKITASIASSSSVHAPPTDGDGLFCDEGISAKYTFPFKDFPRHDGTPCLIYNNENIKTTSKKNNNNAQGNHKNDEMALTFDGSSSELTNNNNNNNNASRPLSDDEFKKQLSLQSVNSTFVIGDDDDDAYGDHPPPQEGAEQICNTEFTEKLERMVTMRLRHYERDTIMMRAREARKKEQHHAEARERQLRLRRHEMEIDLEEIEADLRPPALSRKKSTESTAPLNKKTHRVVASDSNFFSSSSNNLMELEAASRKADDLAHAERLVQAIGNGAKKPPAKVSPSTSPLGFVTPSPTSPHTPVRPQETIRHLQRSPYRSPKQLNRRIPRSPDVRRHMMESVSAQPVHKSRSETSSGGGGVGGGEGEKHANRIPLRDRSPTSRRSRGRSRSAHRRSHSHGSHRRSHSHGSNEFFGNSNETHDVITHGIAAYTHFV